MASPKTKRKKIAPETTQPHSLLSEDDIYLFNEGRHYRLYDHLGAHLSREDGQTGTHFGVWAPNARYVSVIGDFNGWNRESHPLQPRGSSGIWEGFVPEVGVGTAYKYYIASQHNDYTVEKADPFGHYHEVPPKTASVIYESEYAWNDDAWMQSRHDHNALDQPMSIYEMHLGSWMRVPEEENRPLTYRELAPQLADYVNRLGFTHVEFMPIMEHPFYGSWGYQKTGYFAPTSRYGTPDDLRFLIDHLHQNGIGVILDWVPSHFPNDQHGLAYFDGTHLFEHADPRQGFHPDWKSAIFNYGRNEVCSFLISSAVYWLDEFHADGLRVDAVASMLYLDYGRSANEWVPNHFGGRENLDAVEFLRQLNTEVYRAFPDTQTIAEESTAWPMVSRPIYIGGLGFGLKWDMGWMNDTLEYMKLNPVHRRYHHGKLNFRAMYQSSENYVLPLSHDEVVHLKGSLLTRMPGDDWQRFANLRLLLANQWTQPGKKLLFMGGEFGQLNEWAHEQSLDWHLTNHEAHAQIQRTVQQLNQLYTTEAALHEGDCEAEGFAWIDANDAEQSVISFLRRGHAEADVVVCAFNYTPVPRYNYRLGVPVGERWDEIFNSDARALGGSGQGNLGRVDAAPLPYHDYPYTLVLTVPPLAAVFLKPKPGA